MYNLFIFVSEEARAYLLCCKPLGTWGRVCLDHCCIPRAKSSGQNIIHTYYLILKNLFKSTLRYFLVGYTEWSCFPRTRIIKLKNDQDGKFRPELQL